MVFAVQAEADDSMILSRSADIWSLEGDSILVAGRVSLPTNPRHLRTALGRGYLLLDLTDDGEGVLIELCGLPRIVFRLSWDEPASVTGGFYSLDSLPIHDTALIRSVEVVAISRWHSARHCARS